RGAGQACWQTPRLGSSLWSRSAHQSTAPAPALSHATGCWMTPGSTRCHRAPSPRPRLLETPVHPAIPTTRRLGLPFGLVQSLTAKLEWDHAPYLTPPTDRVIWTST